jgi:uncharacterized protein (TIGR00297 family)
MTAAPLAMALLGPVVATVVWRAGLLTTSGAVAAALLGGVCAAAGASWMVLLLTFFGTSVALGRVGRAQKQARSARVIEKAGPRDATQVLANGGLFGLGAAITLAGREQALVCAVALGGLAAAAADTWGTEIGMLARSAPRHIGTWQPLAPGMSGGVTLLGLTATIAGAATLAFVAVLLSWSRPVALAAAVGGIAGALIDSTLGALLQERRRTADGALTERRVDLDGMPTVYAGGVTWMSNDMVNLVATVCGAAIAGFTLIALTRAAA